MTKIFSTQLWGLIIVIIIFLWKERYSKQRKSNAKTKMFIIKLYKYNSFTNIQRLPYV